MTYFIALQITRTTPVRGTFDHPGPSYYGDVGGPPTMRLGMLSGYPSSLTLHRMQYGYGPPSGAPGPYSLLSPYGPSGPLGGSLSFSLCVCICIDDPLFPIMSACSFALYTFRKIFMLSHFVISVVVIMLM